MTTDLETRVMSPSKTSRVFVESEEFQRMLRSARESRRFSNLSAIVVDATETSRYDVFRFLQKEVLHLGAVSVATLLKEAGFGNAKAIYEVLTPNYDYSKENPDMIGISAIVTNVPYANRKIEFFRRTKPNALIIAGGAGYSFNPEIAIKHGADACIVGKAEHSLLELLTMVVWNRLSRDSLRDSFLRLNAGNIQGVYDGSKEKVDFALMVRDLDATPSIDYGLIAGKQARSIRSIKDSEGCINRCDFCSTVLLHRNSYRTCGVERIVNEMRKADKEGIEQVFFIGDHAFAKPYEELKKLTYAIEDARLRISWVAQATIKSVHDNLDKEIIERLERSNCSVLCLGIESINDKDLREMNAYRKNNYEMTKRVLSALKKSPIEIHAMMVMKPFVDEEKKGILPFSVENSERGIRTYRQEVRDMVDFLKEHDVRTAQFHSAIPLPGTKSARDFFNAGIVLKNVGGKLVEWDKYTGQYIVASANPLESHNLMIGAYKRFYSGGYILNPALNIFSLSPKNKLGQIFFRALGRGIVFSHLHTKECKKYARALKRGDFDYYKLGESWNF